MHVYLWYLFKAATIVKNILLSFFIYFYLYNFNIFVDSAIISRLYKELLERKITDIKYDVFYCMCVKVKNC